MDVRRDARWASASERTDDMADIRRCIGSAKFGIEPHEAPVTEFPAQPSQKDGVGRMCKPHWNAYTTALRKAAIARKAAEAAPADPEPVATAEPAKPKRAAKAEAGGG
jgi:hypothetical protein